MPSLLNTIPVYKPQSPANTQAPSGLQSLPTASVSNPFPGVQTYSYVPARPLSPARTTPKGVRPQKVSGSLVKENIFQAAGSTVKSYADYAKYFYDAGFKGEGTDYSVGKINDLGIRAGSLGIAAALAASKQFPLAKGMEFVGLATWFASMAIWPHILGAPIKAKTGVDINQQYIDSSGRRKYVYEDNQYRPMDLYRHVDVDGTPLSEDEYYKKYKDDFAYLDAIGDKLGIPRDIKNRHEAIMNKMGQIAVQGKTLWMLTAGIMTPVLSSIVADAAQNPLRNAIEKHRFNKASKVFDGFEKSLDKLVDINAPFDSRKIQTNLDEIMKELGITVSEQSQQTLKSLLLRDCDLSQADFDVLKNLAEGRFAGTDFGQKLRAALDAAVKDGENLRLPKDKMADVLSALESEAMRNIDGNTKGQLEYLLNRSKHLTQSEFDKLQKFFDNELYGSGVKDVFDNIVKNEVKFTEPNVTLSDSLKEGIKKASIDGVRDAVAKMNKDFASTLPDEIKNFAGLTDSEWQSIISKSRNNNKQELDIISTNSLKNVVKREFLTKLKGVKNLDEDAVEMISKYIDSHIDKYMESQRHYIIPHERVMELFKFAEVNKSLMAKVADYEKASVMNIAESITANNWNRLPQKYLKALNFTKEEIAQLGALDTSFSKQVLAKKFEEIAANPHEYEKVLQQMSALAKEAIEKEEKAILRLTGTVDTPGVLSKIKDLMQSVGGAVFKDSDGVATMYKVRIFDAQNKYRNTVDSFVRPIKILDTFKNLDGYVRNILGGSEEAFNNLVKNNSADYHMFEGLKYEDAVKSLKEYIKDIALDKNDINDWTTKFEHNVPGSKRGMKYSLNMVRNIANIVNGEFGKDTAEIIRKAADEAFINKCNANNTIMRYRYLALDYKLARDFFNNKCYMRDYKPAEALVEEICNGNYKNLHVLEALIDERKAELSLSEIAELKNLRETARLGYKYEIPNKEDFVRRILTPLDFHTSNKSVAEMSGKSVSEFFKDAAQSVRSRSKWTKLVYGLLVGTVAFSTIVIATMGRKNYFNKDIYEKKDA